MLKVIQNRFNGKTDFDRNWITYENGFGDLNAEFWLGQFSYLYKLLFELELKRTSTFQNFKVYNYIQNKIVKAFVYNTI